MSSIISTELVSHAYDDRWLFRDLTIGVQRGQKVALVGTNGAGKSTLLKIMSGTLQAVSGKVVREKGLEVGYLEQDPDFKSAVTVADYIYDSEDVRLQLLRKYKELSDNQLLDTDAAHEVMMRISHENAWEHEHLVNTVLSRLSIHSTSQKLQTLSGGQRKRVALAKLLVDEPDLYILDEPTNHLDIEMIEWLERYLTTGNKTVLMVTHDRYFLDQVCSRIIEIAADGVYNYNGKYAYFLEKKDERLAEQATVQQKNKQLLKKELEWMRRMPQARGTKSKSRINAFYELEGEVKGAVKPQQLSLGIKTARQGKNILEIAHASKAYRKAIITDFSYTFKKGDRIGVAGANGTGKSTLLNLITGVITPDTGAIITGETTKIGYYKQEGPSFDKSMKVIDTVKNIAEYLTLADGSTVTASQLLTQFLFPPARQHVPVGLLSGGERKRLQLMMVLIGNPNFLILDEPTNDLDIDTLNVLEDFLERYTGVLLLVSHDRYLMDRLCEQLFILGDGDVKIYNGNYSDYRLEAEEAKQQPAKAGSKPLATHATKDIKRLSYKEEKELASLVELIEHAEVNLKMLETSLQSSTDYSDIAAISEKIGTLKSDLDAKTERWMELSALKEN